MPPGKAAAQAGHAFLDAFLKSNLKAQAAYFARGEGTKVVLTARDEAELRSLYERAEMAGLPCALVIERDHILPPHFDGRPIVTALGIGPAARGDIHPLTRRLRLH